MATNHDQTMTGEEVYDTMTANILQNYVVVRRLEAALRQGDHLTTTVLFSLLLDLTDLHPGLKHANRTKLLKLRTDLDRALDDKSTPTMHHV